MTEQELLDLAIEYDQGSGATFEFDEATLVRLLRDVEQRSAQQGSALYEKAKSFHDTYCPNCPDGDCSLGYELRSRQR